MNKDYIVLLGGYPKLEEKDIIMHNAATPKAEFVTWMAMLGSGL